jgi:argininosuccinate lyase
MAYNRDLQEDKAAVIAARDTLLPSLVIFAGMLPALHFNLERMREAAGASYSLATDIADYLVKRGMPFREAHGVVGGLVREADARGCELNQLPFETYQSANSLFERDVLAIDVDSSIASRDVTGGTAPGRVRAAAGLLRKALED